MKQVIPGLKYTINEDGNAQLFAKLKTTGKFAPFGTCHLETLKVIRETGIKNSLNLIRF